MAGRGIGWQDRANVIVRAASSPGVRVVSFFVTARFASQTITHPPIPDDVPPKHPLRDPAIVRTPGRSPHAEVTGVPERERPAGYACPSE